MRRNHEARNRLPEDLDQTETFVYRLCLPTLKRMTLMRSTNPGFVPDSPFTRELTAKQLAFFSAFPKAELHCHLLGTTSRETFIDLIRDSDAPISMAEIEGFYTRGEKPVGVLRIFRALESSILKKPEYLKRITLEHLERTAAQGVRYIELFWNWTGLKHFMTYAEGQDAIVAGLIEGEEKYGIVGRLVPSIDREALPEDAVELVREMAAHRSPWVIGLGIDYRETLHEPENFWKAYRLARDAGFKLTAHAGEFGEHWRNVETAMDLLECERIDHGYTITDNPELAERAADQGIPFAVVPTNSYYLRTFTDEEWAVKHPIRRMVELGLKVFPNSDDPTMHHISISESWLLMMNWLGFSLADLRGFLVNSIDAAWVDDETKIVWRQLWLPEFDRLAREAFGADCLPTA